MPSIAASLSIDQIGCLGIVCLKPSRSADDYQLLQNDPYHMLKLLITSRLHCLSSNPCHTNIQPTNHQPTCSISLSGKMHRMREFMYFFDPPSYYERPGMTEGQRVVVSGAASEGQSQGGTRASSFASNR